MELNEYQEKAAATAIYPHAGSGSLTALAYVTLGLGGETGEIQEKVKKIIRDSGGVIDDAAKVALMKEAGDVLWYLSRLAAEMDSSLDHIARLNLDKLESRRARGVIGGSGDDR